jgi:hypothetical protein
VLGCAYTDCIVILLSHFCQYHPSGRSRVGYASIISSNHGAYAVHLISSQFRHSNRIQWRVQIACFFFGLRSKCYSYHRFSNFLLVLKVPFCHWKLHILIFLGCKVHCSKRTFFCHFTTLFFFSWSFLCACFWRNASCITRELKYTFDDSFQDTGQYDPCYLDIGFVHAIIFQWFYFSPFYTYWGRCLIWPRSLSLHIVARTKLWKTENWQISCEIVDSQSCILTSRYRVYLQVHREVTRFV